MATLGPRIKLRRELRSGLLEARMRIARRIRLARERTMRSARPVSATELATLLGYAKPQNSWWRIEAGHRGLTLPQLAIVAAALRVSCDRLITGRESRFAMPRRVVKAAAAQQKRAA